MEGSTDSLLKRFHHLMKSPSPPFHHGMATQQGREKRDFWLDILNQLRYVPHFPAESMHAHLQQQTLLEDVKSSIRDAILYLIHGDHAMEEEDTLKQIRVWSSPQNARLAIIQEAIALAHSRRDAPIHTNPPLIILISQSYEASQQQQQTTTQNFLDSWSATSYSVAQVLTIQADSSEKVLDSLHHLFQSITQSEMHPVLIVIHASQDSSITTGLTAIKRICQSWNVRLCVEGPAMAMLAQLNRPSDPEECATEADVLLLDPASWFGFRMCALVSSHKLVKSPVLREFKDHYSRLLADPTMLKDQDESHGLATAPILNLWTVLSRIGLQNIRDSTDAVTVLAETLVNDLKDSTNIVTAYDGIGCVVRVSYALSREDRLLPREKSHEHVSLVNDVIFSSIREDSEVLCIQQGLQSEGNCLNFAPARLLSSGTLWIPPVDIVHEFCRELQDTVDKYECCRAASVAFQSCVAKCREIQLLKDTAEQPELHLSFGAFRIVPFEMGQIWDQNEGSAEIVEGLTTLVAKELTEYPHDISTPKYVVQEETERARALAEQFSRGPGGLLRPAFLSKAFNRRWSFSHGCGRGEPLPFDVFLHSDSKSRFHDFVSIEPREKCKPVHAVNQATIASELMITCVTKIMELWRAGEITFPLESEVDDESISNDAENLNQGYEYVETADPTEEDAPVESQHLEQTSDEELTFDDAPLPSGSEISCPTESNEEEGNIASHRRDGPEAVLRNREDFPSASNGDYEQEAETTLQVQEENNEVNAPYARQNDDYTMKDVLSLSTIEKSSRGTRTDEDAIPSDYALPTAAKTAYPASLEENSEASDMVSAVEEMPAVHGTARRGWFGSWRTRRWGNCQTDDNDYDSESDSFDEGEDESDEKSNSSVSGGGSSGDSKQRGGRHQDGPTEEDDRETHESGSSSLDESSDDGFPRDDDNETSEEDDKENQDSICDGSSTASTDTTEEHAIRAAQRTKEPSSNRLGRSSRLLAWIRRGKAQQQKKAKPHTSNPPPNKHDSESTSTSSESDLEDEETRIIHSSEEDGELLPTRRGRALPSRQQGDDDASDESNEESLTDSEIHDSDRNSYSSDEKREGRQRIRTQPGTRSYGFGWFGRTEKPLKSSLTRARRRTPGSGSGVSSSTGTETESQDSSVRDKRLCKSSKKRQKEGDSCSESQWSEGTDISHQSDSNCSTEETSEGFATRRHDTRKNATCPRQTTESSSTEGSSMSIDNTSSSSNDNAKDGRSFFDWILPSWATTPPKLGKRKAPVQVNSLLRESFSSQTSTDSDSEESYRGKRRTEKEKNRNSSGGNMWSQRLQSRRSSSSCNRQRRTLR